MAVPLSLTQLSSGNPVYEKFYRLVDPGNIGRVGASEAALFLKKSGLSDLTLGKIWDLADADRKGWLDKQGFYVALRLVACAQNGHEIALSALSHVVPPPAFKDTGSPQLGSSSAQNPDAFWVVKPDEKTKFDGIFDSLGPANGLLSGEKVKPVLINSNLPMEVLSKVWELSDIDKDGHLDRDEFAVAMHLVYRALDKEPVPSVIPPKLVPPGKRSSIAVSSSSTSSSAGGGSGGGGKFAGSLPGAVAVLPSSPPAPRDSLRSTPSHGSVSSLASGGSLSPKLQPRLLQQTQATWVVTPSDKIKYDEIFLKTDLDMDGFVSGVEVKDIFMQSGLPQTVLAQIWALADTRQQGKLTQDQFALAMYLITQKVSKGADPPATLSAEMLPPSERTASATDGASGAGSADFSAIKELDAISAEITELQREKASLEQDIREKEEAIRYQTTEVQDMQGELDRETNTLQEMQSQNQGSQERLGELEQQRAKLEAMLSDLQLKCQEETQTISSLRIQIASQESTLRSQEDDLSKAKGELSRLQHEENQMEQRLEAGKAHLETIVRSLQATQQEISQVRGMLAQLTESQGVGGSFNGSLEVPHATEKDSSRSSPFLSRSGEDAFHSKAPMFPPSSADGKSDAFQKEHAFATESVFKAEDPFKGSDPFQGDPFAGQEEIADPFGEDPFKGSDPFGGSSAGKPSKSSLAITTTTSSSSSSTSASKDPFGKSSAGSGLFGSASGTTGSDPFLKVTGGGDGGGAGGRSDPFSKPGASSADLFSRAGSDADPFRSKSAGPFSKAVAEDPFSANSSDPFGGSTAAATKADPFKAPDPFAPGGVRPTSAGGADPFSSLDPFGSSTFDSKGFADFGNSSRPGSTDPFSDSSGGAGASDPFGSGAFSADDPFRSREAVPNLPPKRSAPPRPKPPSSSGTSTPTKRGDASDASLPFQPFGGGTDPFHSRGGFEEDGCGRTDPFSATQPAPGKSSKGFGFGSESDQMAWATWESERAERERLDRLKRQEQEDLELAIALSKSEMSKP